MAGKKKKKKKSKGKSGKKSGLPDGFDSPAQSTGNPGYDYLQMSCPPSRMVWF
jgi:hypothetical protein